MASSSFFMLILLLLVPTISYSTSFNITTLLSPHPSFSAFNDLISFTNLSCQVKPLPSFTLLVVKNSAVSAVAARPLPSLRRILSLHILLNYYDESHLRLLASSTSPLLPTLFHDTGAAAPPHMGSLNITTNGRDIVFSSAVDGGGDAIHSKFMKQIVSKPYNISIIEISAVIVPPGVTTIASSPAKSIPGFDRRHRDNIPPAAAESIPPAYGLPPLAAGSPGLSTKDENASSPSPLEVVSSGNLVLVAPFFGAVVLMCISTVAIFL